MAIKVQRTIFWDDLAIRDMTVRTSPDIDLTGVLDARIIYRSSLDQILNLTALSDFNEPGTFGQAGTLKAIAANAGTGVALNTDTNFAQALGLRGGKVRFTAAAAVNPTTGTFYCEIQLTYDV